MGYGVLGAGGGLQESPLGHWAANLGVQAPGVYLQMSGVCKTPKGVGPQSSGGCRGQCSGYSSLWETVWGWAGLGWQRAWLMSALQRAACSVGATEALRGRAPYSAFSHPRPPKMGGRVRGSVWGSGCGDHSPKSSSTHSITL